MRETDSAPSIAFVTARLLSNPSVERVRSLQNWLLYASADGQTAR